MNNKSNSLKNESKRHKWQRITVDKNIDWKSAASTEGLQEVSAFIESTVAWILPHRYFQIEHSGNDISMYSVTDANKVAKAILTREKRHEELEKLKNMENPAVVASCVKLICNRIIPGASKHKSKRELFHRHLDLVTAHRKAAEEEFYAVKRRSNREWTDQQKKLALAIEANQKQLNKVPLSDQRYLFLLNDRHDVYEKYEQTFHKGDILRDDLLYVVSYLDAEIRAYEEYHMLAGHKVTV